MNRLIDDLLVLSAAEGPVPLRTEPLLVHHVLSSVVAREATRHPQATIRLDVPPGLPPAAGDPTLLEQVVRNLVGNAAKYAGSRPEIRVAARSTEDAVEVSVSDNGPGVPAEDQEAVFGIFFRSGSTAGRAGGAGVGLYVCRRLVEAMGGQIGVRSTPGEGASFHFALPLYAARVESAAAATSPGSGRG
jgi:signal transduction histidine kinase